MPDAWRVTSPLSAASPRAAFVPIICGICAALSPNGVRREAISA